MLALYISERLQFTDISGHKLKQDNNVSRYYFGHKAAKDILMLMGNKKRIKLKDLKSKLFEGKAILNYLNDMILNIILYHSEVDDSLRST